MAITMEQVINALYPEEPDYSEAARLGPGALSHIEDIIRIAEPNLASKATYLASLISADNSAQILQMAAKTSHPMVRMAAAAAAENLTPTEASRLLSSLLEDEDAGVRIAALKSIPESSMPDLGTKIRFHSKMDVDFTVRQLSNEVLSKLEQSER